MEIYIGQGTPADLAEIGQLYNDLHDHLAQTVNYPGWVRGIYPVLETAQDGIAQGTLYLAKLADKIVGSVILNHMPEQGYDGAPWAIAAEPDQVLVIHTFVTHPAYQKLGVGKALLAFAEQLGRLQGMKAIRLDVYQNNLPAIGLYEKCGYRYVDTVDLGLGCYGLDWFKLYEKLL